MMKWSNINVPLGLNAPYGSSRKEAAATAIALGTAGAGLLSGIANLFSSADTNKANRQIAEQNREWQSQENRLSEQWQEKMWNATNQYNTPSAMKKRVEEAGYNPYLFDGSKLAGSGSGASMPSSPAKQSAPDMPVQRPLDFSFAGNAASSAANAYYGARINDANVANQTADTHLKNAQAVSQIYQSLGKDAAQKFAHTVGYNMDDTSPIVKTTELNLERQDLENTRISLENRITRLYGDKKAQAEVQNLNKMSDKYSAEINLLAMQAKQTNANLKVLKKQAEALGAQAARDFQQSQLYKTENDIKLRSADYLVWSTYYQMQIDQNRWRISNYEENNAWMNNQNAGSLFQAQGGSRSWLQSQDAYNASFQNIQTEFDPTLYMIKSFTESFNTHLGINASSSNIHKD